LETNHRACEIHPIERVFQISKHKKRGYPIMK
jgi:hypothetical protein